MELVRLALRLLRLELIGLALRLLLCLLRLLPLLGLLTAQATRMAAAEVLPHACHSRLLQKPHRK